ncbi:MAG TPA: inositol 2-dehydrogenase [Burkholderiaceae bacterium]|nr:inositol 2-dehydrogenase [Burkholderiaceae bacterium]
MSSSAPIEIALFGAGRIGQIHAGNLARQTGVTLKYVVDVNAEAARALAARFGAQVVGTEAALADGAVRAVAIASSTDTHSDLIHRAAAAGKAIFCEKPVDLDLTRARACAAAVSKAGVACHIGFQRRFDPTFAALKEKLVAGAIGDPEMLVVTSRDPAPPPIPYIRSSGGIFSDMLIHDFDLCRWILDDDAVSVFAAGSCLVDPAIASAGDIDSTAVTIRTRRGRLCQINTSRRAAYGYDQRFEVLGARGLLQAGNQRTTEVTVFDAAGVSGAKPEPFFLERYRAAYAAEVAHFIEALKTNSVVRCTIDDAVKAQELAAAATRSWKEGRVVTLA